MDQLPVEPIDPQLYDLAPDPFAGPPENADALLADLTPAEMEAMFTTPADAVSGQDEQPVGAGFAAGGWLDELFPGRFCRRSRRTPWTPVSARSKTTHLLACYAPLGGSLPGRQRSSSAR